MTENNNQNLARASASHSPCTGVVITPERAAFESDDSMTELIEVASRMAATGAREYLAAHKLQTEPNALAACLKSWIKIKLPEALADAKEALACHMGQVAEATFAATMMQAGIEAAKESSGGAK